MKRIHWLIQVICLALHERRNRDSLLLWIRWSLQGARYQAKPIDPELKGE